MLGAQFKPDILYLRSFIGNAGALPLGLPRMEKTTMSGKVTVQEVERVAELAHLELTAEETPRMLKDLNAILDYVAELNELYTVGIAPLAQVSELLGGSGAGVLREDVVRPSLDRAVVFSQAPEADGTFFKVPKVIER
jgi:aspartyl-tRNA(Asn)/glutamyl-tRNA(Gln) amidotransferase subunit C